MTLQQLDTLAGDDEPAEAVAMAALDADIPSEAIETSDDAYAEAQTTTAEDIANIASTDSADSTENAE